jgi:hypothetical protein
MKLEWPGAHGHHALSAQAVTVPNGVSQRTTPHPRQGEQVVKGRCGAIVRVPWDDDLAEPAAERGIRESLVPGGASRLDRLRPAVLQAYTALAEVLIGTLVVGQGQRRVTRRPGGAAGAPG